MIKKITGTLIFTLFSILCYSQTGQLIVTKNIHLPADSLQSRLLIASMNGFLDQIVKPNKENTFVLKNDLPETAALLDEIRGMDSGNGPEKQGIFKCYLTNIMSLDSADYLIQFSYIGLDKSVPILRASFQLVAKKEGGQIYFCSPLKRNTIGWKTINIGNFSFFYNAPVDLSKLKRYAKNAKTFDEKLNAPKYITQIYICNNILDATEILGVQYKLDYNGQPLGNFSSFTDGVSLNLAGESYSDPAFLDIHDLWHDRLHHVVSVNIINKPVDEGCAYLYGGSWGISWRDIFKKFKTYMGTDKDWLKALNENKNFGASHEHHLYTQYVINALIVQQIEKKKGFGPVIELLSCGKQETNDGNYFQTLERITGINKTNFNMNIEKLVEEESMKLGE